MSHRKEIVLMKQMGRRTTLTLPFPRNWNEGLLKRRAAGCVDGRTPKFSNYHLRHEKIAAIADVLPTSPER
jgi:hypothetical protein